MSFEDSVLLEIEGVSLRVSDLADVIEAKRAASRPKDLATLLLLEQFRRVREAIDEGRQENG